MKIRFALTAAALLAAAFLFLLLPLPARPLPMPRTEPATPTAVGAFHVHTNRSDGSGSPDEVAEAAARADLQFVILADHGDGTRAPDPPQYRSGVLVIDSVELSTAGGHYIAVGLSRAPYPLRGEARDVVEDVRRLGGFGVVAHPDSAKPALQWQDWSAPVDAVEWLNADSEWRDEDAIELARALVRYPFRPIETLASTLDRPDRTLSRWDTLTQRRRVTALAGLDAHARTGWSDEEANGSRHGWFLRIPAYVASFRTFAIRVFLERALGGDAHADAVRLMTALKAGRVYSAIDGIGFPSSLEFSASAEGRTVAQGESLDAGGVVTFSVRSSRGAGVVVLRRDGSIVTQHPLPDLAFQSKEYGTYRVEVSLSSAPGKPPVPWILSNPIYVRPAGWGTPSVAPQPVAVNGSSIQGGPWTVEKDDGSAAEIMPRDPAESSVRLAYSLAAGERSGQYAALVIGVGTALSNRTWLTFRGHASHPMRISVQARRPQSGERWQRSIYLDATPRDIFVPFSELRAVGTMTDTFDPRLVDTLLFVVDTTNTPPGTSGSFTIAELRLGR